MGVNIKSRNKAGSWSWLKILFAIALLFSSSFSANVYAGDQKTSCGKGGNSWFDVLRGCPSQLTVLMDNDKFLSDNTDRYYTNGLNLDLKFFGRPPENSAETAKKNYGFVFAQEIYTPSDITLENPDGMDRPYAGWLYGGFYREILTSDESYYRLELDIGVLGDASRADDVQFNWHEIIGVTTPKGWDYQIGDEIGFRLHYERIMGNRWNGLKGEMKGKIRHHDLVPFVSWDLGNIYTNISWGVIGRAGWLRSYFDGNGIIDSYHDYDNEGGENNFLFYMREVYGYFKLEPVLVLHNATLEGGLYDKFANHNSGSPVIRPKTRVVIKMKLGASLNWRKISINYVWSIISPELWWEDDNENFWEDIKRLRHKYGSVEFSYRF